MIIKKSSTKITILILFFIVISLSGCFSHWQGDSAKVVIYLGGTNRAAIDYDPTDSETHKRLEHKIKFTGASKTLEYSSNGGTTIEVYAEPGDWNVEIVSWLDGDVYAAGYKDVSLKLGLNNETINMFQAHLVKFVSGSVVQEQIIFHANYVDPIPEPVNNNFSPDAFEGWYNDTFTESIDLTGKRIIESITLYAKWTAIDVFGNSLAAKLKKIEEKPIDGGFYVVNVGENEPLLPTTLSYKGKTLTITLTSDDNTPKTINLENGHNGSMFTVGSGVTLKLDSYITLKGHNNNNKPLISVSGKLIMNPLSKIIKNKNNGGVCGGVFIKGGNFIMNGGEISDNYADQGGGVWVEGGGTFTMNGGEISGNTAVGWGGGGGVFVNSNATFTMTDGKISGNVVNGNKNDDWKAGGGVFIDANGKFTMDGGEISDNHVLGSLNNEAGGVFVGGGTFIMNKGNISNNTAENISGGNAAGGGVKVANKTGKFTMTGGKISNNQSRCGGGVQVGGGEDPDYGGTFTMTGGEISQNEAKESGGGVFVGCEINNTATFIMEGGKIFDNKANYGGGVSVWNGIFDKPAKPNGGEISGNIATNKDNNAVFANNDNEFIKIRNRDIQSNEALSYNGIEGTASQTGWDE